MRRRRFLRNAADKGSVITFVAYPRYTYQQNEISENSFEQTFDDLFLVNYLGFDPERDIKNMVRADFDEMGPTGLAQYMGDDRVKSIVGEFDDGKLTITCRLAPGVSPNSIVEELKDYVTGQLSDGWGEGFEQQPIECPTFYAVYNEEDDMDVEYFARWGDAENDADEKNAEVEEDEYSDDTHYEWVQIDDCSCYVSFWGPGTKLSTYIDNYDESGLDREGYDREGYDRVGYDRRGYDREGYDRYDRDRGGYDREGYDKYGKDRGGFDRSGSKPMPGSGPVKFNVNKGGRVSIANPYENLRNSRRSFRRIR